MKYLSTLEVAKMMNVTETTIKRWADGGEVPCHKTPGGHRKFLLKDIFSFAEHHGYPLEGMVTPPFSRHQSDVLQFAVETKNYSKIAGLFYEEALQGDRNGLFQLLSYLCRNQIAISTLGDEVIRPAMGRIGEEWMAGRLDIDREHIASNSVVEALVRLSPELHRKPSNGLSAVCACAEGDYHQIGLLTMAYALEADGWNIHLLGANTPFSTLQSFMKIMKPELVCVSSTVIVKKKQLIDGLRAVGTTAHSYGATYIVGGFFLKDHTPEEFHSDYISASVHDALAMVKDRFQLRPGPKRHKV